MQQKYSVLIILGGGIVISGLILFFPPTFFQNTQKVEIPQPLIVKQENGVATSTFVQQPEPKALYIVGDEDSYLAPYSKDIVLSLANRESIPEEILSTLPIQKEIGNVFGDFTLQSIEYVWVPPSGMMGPGTEELLEYAQSVDPTFDIKTGKTDKGTPVYRIVSVFFVGNTTVRGTLDMSPALGSCELHVPIEDKPKLPPIFSYSKYYSFLETGGNYLIVPLSYEECITGTPVEIEVTDIRQVAIGAPKGGAGFPAAKKARIISIGE